MNPAEYVTKAIEQYIEDIEKRISEATEPVPHLHAQLAQQREQLDYVRRNA